MGQIKGLCGTLRERWSHASIYPESGLVQELSKMGPAKYLSTHNATVWMHLELDVVDARRFWDLEQVPRTRA